MGVPAANAGLEQDVDTLLARQGQYIPAVSGHHLLVGGGHMLAQRGAFEDVVQGGLLTTHDLYYDVHLRVTEDGINIGGEQMGRHLIQTLLGWVSYQSSLQ